MRENAQTKGVTDTVSKLIAAYNLIFDVKDSQPSGSSPDYLAYEALGKIEALLVGFGVEAPRRFDNKVA